MSLERTLLKAAVRREDRRYIPLLVETAKLIYLGHDAEYVVNCAFKYYDGRDLNSDKYLKYIETGMVL